MNVFGNIKLTGYKGIFKPGVFYKKGATLKERTFVIESEPDYKRLVRGHFLDGSKGLADHYDFIEVIAPDGTHVRQPETEFHD